MLFTQIIIFLAAALPFINAAAIIKPNNQKDVIKDAYIVVMKDGISAEEFSNHRLWAADIHTSRLAKRGSSDISGVKYTYDIGNLKGYSGSFDADTIKEIASSSQVR
jgi:hypothetical protein